MQCGQIGNGVSVNSKDSRLFPTEEVRAIHFVNRNAGELDWRRHTICFEIDDFNRVYLGFSIWIIDFCFDADPKPGAISYRLECQFW